MFMGRMRTLILSTFVALVVLALSAGVALAAAGGMVDTSRYKKAGPYTIGYDIYFAGNTWSVQMYNEFKAAVARHSNLVKNVIYTESENDIGKQIANIEDLITRKVDAIIMTPVSPAATVPVIEKAYRAGIPVILLAATSNTDKYTSLVTVNDTDFGAVGAKWLADKLHGKGQIIALNGIAGISVSEDRWKGAKQVFQKYPGIKIIATVNADWDYAKAKLAVASLLAAHPHIDGVWSQGGEMTLGAIEAFQAAGRKLVPMTGEDNNGFLKAWKKLQPSGFTSIAVSKPTWLSAEALDTALAILQGKPVKKDNVLPVPVITDATLAKYVRPDLPDSFWANSRLSDAQIKALFKK